MEKILILSPLKYYNPFILIFFLKYLIKNNDISTNDICNNMSTSWHDYSKLSPESIHKKYNFTFNNFDITFIFTQNIDFINQSDYEKSLFESFKYFKRTIFIDFRFFFENFDEHELYIFNKNQSIEYVFFSVEERTTRDLDKSLLDAHNLKIITCDFDSNLKHEKIFSYPFLSFFHFFYVHGYNYLNFYDFNNTKTNLIGTYIRKNYKTERDFLIKKVEDKFDTSYKSLLKIFELEFYKNEKIKEITDFYNVNLNFWDKNHISSYTDYINSVCILLFETDADMSTDRIFFTEKTFKALLFSKLNIPFLIFCPIGNLLYLKENGYWFLNFEFIDFDKFGNNSDFNSKHLVDSILKSTDFLLKKYQEHDGDLNKIHLFLIDQYGEKMQNNFNSIMNELVNPSLNEEFLDFILKDKRINKNEINTNSKKLF